MAYNTGAFIPDYHAASTRRIRERIEKNSESRDAKARIMMEKLKEERIAKNQPSPRDPVLVSRKMKHLPKPGIY